MRDYHSLLILLVICRCQSYVELTANLQLVGVVLFYYLNFLILILSFYVQLFYINLHMKVEAIIGKNDEAIMNFEKVRVH